MKKSNYTKYFRVFKYDTSVTEVSTNDFKPIRAEAKRRESLPGDFRDTLCIIPSNPYSLPADDCMFYGYSTRVHAMEKAKAGAQAYINLLTDRAEAGIQKLKQYRMDHYEDLNINLLEANIRRLEKEIQIK